MSNTAVKNCIGVSKAWIEIVEKHLFTLFQYGFVNYALELLVLKTFGEETWEQIKYVTLLPVYHYNFYNSKMFHIFSQIAQTFFGIFMYSFLTQTLFIQI